MTVNYHHVVAGQIAVAACYTLIRSILHLVFLMSSASQPSLSPVEYLERELGAVSKSIYWGGEIFAMAGASFEHVLIAGNIHVRLCQAFLESSCVAMQSDMRVKIQSSGNYVYPDVVVTCEQPSFENLHGESLLNPQIIFEVLSRSTESFDRGLKFRDYQKIDSLQQYVLVSQYRPWVESFRRQSNGTWEYWSSGNLDERLVLVPETGIVYEFKMPA